ncbi:MAG: hypothetical protein HKN78_09190 [Sphingomonadaceae bacterium]|nr:hypothetical protein [Sphingomonadaceae bacterium]
MTHRAALFAAAILACCITPPAIAQMPLAPERTVEANSIVSERDPEVRVSVPETAVYVGATRWHLYDVADAEVHVFVEAGEDRLVERFYWIQFEQYLPSRPDARYDYPESNPETATLSGRSVHVSAGFGPGSGHQSRPGSDSEAFRRLVADNGYLLPRAMASVRFVELFEPTQRKELMIIYGEDMTATVQAVGETLRSGAEGVTADDLYAPLIERARSRIALDPPGND